MPNIKNKFIQCFCYLACQPIYKFEKRKTKLKIQLCHSVTLKGKETPTVYSTCIHLAKGLYVCESCGTSLITPRAHMCVVINEVPQLPQTWPSSFHYKAGSFSLTLDRIYCWCQNGRVRQPRCNRKPCYITYIHKYLKIIVAALVYSCSHICEL